MRCTCEDNQDTRGPGDAHDSQASSASDWRQTLERRLLSTPPVHLMRVTVWGLLALLTLVPMAARAQEPVVVLQAVDARGQTFDLVALRGKVVALTFVSRYTQDEAHQVLDALSRHSDIKVVNVVDFTGIPRFVHGFVRKKVAQAAASGHVQQLCDERGDLGRRFGADPGKHVDIFIIDREGVLRGHFAGMSQLDQAERRLDEVRSSEAQR
jgi:hypothetical protein